MFYLRITVQKIQNVHLTWCTTIWTFSTAPHYHFLQLEYNSCGVTLIQPVCVPFRNTEQHNFSLHWAKTSGLFCYRKDKSNCQGHGDIEWKYRHSFSLSLISKLDGVGDQSHAPDFHARKEKRFLLYGMLGGPQDRSGRERKISPLLGFHPRTIQPVANCYTD